MIYIYVNICIHTIKAFRPIRDGKLFHHDLQDGPGGDHDDEHEGYRGQSPDQAGQRLRLNTQLNWPISHRRTNQHRQRAEKRFPVKKNIFKED